jgi:hypothetical protein
MDRETAQAGVNLVGVMRRVARDTFQEQRARHNPPILRKREWGEEEYRQLREEYSCFLRQTALIHRTAAEDIGARIERMVS